MGKALQLIAVPIHADEMAKFLKPQSNAQGVMA